MSTPSSSPPRTLKVAVTAMGGQGGGVLTDWIVKLAEKAGYFAQSTSVPGVAQRTGATVYYVELFPRAEADKAGKAPVMALTPVPGDVDIVISSELMEAGRAILRGFVSEKTVLITSSHRILAVSEKIGMGDGRQKPDDILRIAQERAGTFIAADMNAAAIEAGSVISSVLFGALAGSKATPFPRDAFEQTIRDMGRAVESNLKGFDLGFKAASGQLEVASVAANDDAPVVTEPARAVRPLLDRMAADFPARAHDIIREGLKKLVDYQGPGYARLYLDRLADIKALDETKGGERRDWRLTRDVARYLALWMAFEDTIRVADLKTRGTRFDRFRDDVKAAPGQIVQVTEFMHPRVEEICDLLPPAMGRAVLNAKGLRKLIDPLFKKGRYVKTTSLGGFLMLSTIAALRPVRRFTLRYSVEQARITGWLDQVKTATGRDYDIGCETAGLARLIKGYGDTHERGLANFARISEVAGTIDADAIRTLRDAALKDEDGIALEAAFKALEQKKSA